MLTEPKLVTARAGDILLHIVPQRQAVQSQWPLGTALVSTEDHRARFPVNGVNDPEQPALG